MTLLNEPDLCSLKRMSWTFQKSLFFCFVQEKSPQTVVSRLPLKEMWPLEESANEILLQRS